MENEMHFMVARERKDIELHDKMYPDKGPWCVRWLDSGHRASKHEHLIFGELIEEIRSFVQKDGVTVHLYNVMREPLLQINPENVEAGLYESLGVLEVTSEPNKTERIKHITSYEDSRPVCPSCGGKAGLEPAHWRSQNKEKKGQWRWVCVSCDYAVSSSVDDRFRPTGDMASRKLRELRGEARNEFSKLWEKQIVSKSDAYDLLHKHFGIDKGELRITGELWGFASMNISQLNETISLSQNIIKLWKEKQVYK